MQLEVNELPAPVRGVLGTAITCPREITPCGVLVEQQPERVKAAGRRTDASNVLYAIAIADIVKTFGLYGLPAYRPVLPWDSVIENLTSPIANRPIGESRSAAGAASSPSSTTGWTRTAPVPDRRRSCRWWQDVLAVHWLDRVAAAADRPVPGSTGFFVRSACATTRGADAVLGAVLTRLGRAYGRRADLSNGVAAMQADSGAVA